MTYSRIVWKAGLTSCPFPVFSEKLFFWYNFLKSKKLVFPESVYVHVSERESVFPYWKNPPQIKHQPIKSCQKRVQQQARYFPVFKSSKLLTRTAWLGVMHVAFLLLLKCLKIFPHNCLFLQMLYFCISSFYCVVYFPMDLLTVFNLHAVSNGKDLKIKITALNLSEVLPTDKQSDHVLLVMVCRDCYCREKVLLTDGAECLFHEWFLACHRWAWWYRISVVFQC